MIYAFEVSSHSVRWTIMADCGLLDWNVADVPKKNAKGKRVAK
jgi:hypothetical protein